MGIAAMSQHARIEIDPTRIRFEPRGEYERAVIYGGLQVMRQFFNDPDCPIERQRAIDAAVSLLEFKWTRMSQHERLETWARCR